MQLGALRPNVDGFVIPLMLPKTKHGRLSPSSLLAFSARQLNADMQSTMNSSIHLKNEYKESAT